MHRASHYLESRVAPNAKRHAVEAYSLTAADELALSGALPTDANDYYYSSCMSIVDGLRAIDSGFYTWSTVKLYYAVFYAVRAILAWDKIAVFRPGDRAPFHVTAVAGAFPRFIAGKGSHKSMLNCFRRLKPAHFLLSQTIELGDGLTWLLEKRESANYGIPRFCEPEIPEHYEQIVRIGVRKAIAAYLEPEASLLTFDKDHSIVSFPLASLMCAGDSAKVQGGATIGRAEEKFLVKKCQERGGALAPLLTFIRGTIKS